MKPQAPAEIRGEFRPIATSVPGIEITEHLPLVSQQVHHLALVRSLEMPGVENSHGWGYYYMCTGHPPDPARYELRLARFGQLGSIRASGTAQLQAITNPQET